MEWSEGGGWDNCNSIINNIDTCVYVCVYPGVLPSGTGKSRSPNTLPCTCPGREEQVRRECAPGPSSPV